MTDRIKHAENLQLLTLCEPSDTITMARECMCAVIDAYAPPLKRIMVVDGYSDLASNKTAMYEYDVRTETWHTLPFTNPFRGMYAVFATRCNELVYFTDHGIYKMQVNRFLEHTPGERADCSVTARLEVHNPDDFKYDDGSAFVAIDNNRMMCFAGQIGEYRRPPDRTVPASAVFDIEKATWTVVNHVLLNIVMKCVKLRDGRIFLSGGIPQYPYDRDAMRNPLIYNPVMHRLTRVPPMVLKRYAHALCLMRNGRVLVSGGSIRGSNGLLHPTNRCEEYDPDAHKFVEVGSMLCTRMRHRCMLLPSGKVLVMGGVDVIMMLNTELDTCEVYDPDTRTFSLAAAMPAHLRGFHVIPLYA